MPTHLMPNTMHYTDTFMLIAMNQTYCLMFVYICSFNQHFLCYKNAEDNEMVRE